MQGLDTQTTPKSTRAGLSSSPKSLLKDVGALRQELQRKEEENQALQDAFDDYVESSKELEEELEVELEKAESCISELAAEKARLTERLQSATEKMEGQSSFLSKVEKDLETLRAQHKTLKEQKWQLEQRNDDIEEKLRIVEASHENVKHKLERAIEENVFITSDMEELKKSSAEQEQRLRTEINDSNAEILVLKSKLEALQKGESENSVQSTGEETSHEEESNSHGHASVEQVSSKSDGDAELAMLRERLVDVELKNEELTAELAGVESGKTERLRAELNSVSDEKQSLEKNVEALMVALEGHESQKRSIEAQLASLQKETSAATTSLEAALNEAQEQASDLKTQLADAAAELEEKKSLLATTQQKVNQLNNRLEAEASEQSNLKDQIIDLQEQLDKESARTQELESELSNMAKKQREQANAEGQQNVAKEKERLEIRVKELENKLLDLKKRRMLKRGNSLGSVMSPGSGPFTPFFTESPSSPSGHKRQSSLGIEKNPIPKQLDMDVSNTTDNDGTLTFADPAIAEKSSMILDPSSELQEKLKELQDQFEEQCLENAQLLRQIQQIKGNIQVCCRIRPATMEEQASETKVVLESLGEGEVGFWDRRNERWSSYTFDRVWGWNKTQSEVYRDIAPVAIGVVDGFNACIFAYGQTGSGKTHTMIGPPSDPGVSERTVRQIFHMLELKTSQYNQEAAEKACEDNKNYAPTPQGSSDEPPSTFEWSMRVAMMEIYNEELRDLLAEQSGNSLSGFGAGGERKNEGGGLEIRRASTGAQCEIPGLTYRSVSKMEEVLAAFEQGNANRATAATDLNAHSSRSHSILTVEVTTNENDGLPKTGRLHLVDLAGSERVKNSNVVGKELKEAQYINRSLSALGDVMEALDQKHSHVPYRNSKLTYFLQDSIGGSSLTLMIVTVCPTEASYEETNHALEFAWRVRHIQRQPIQRNVQTKNLQEKLKQARAELRQVTKKKEHAEEALALAKREQKASASKMATVLENRVRNMDEINKTREKRIDDLKVKNSSITKRYESEKALREKFQGEAEESQRVASRIELQVTNLQRDNEMLKERISAREAELTVLKRELRTAQVSSRLASGQPSGSRRGSTMNRTTGIPAHKNASSIRQKFTKREAELSRSSNITSNQVSDSLQGGSRGPRRRMSTTSMQQTSRYESHHDQRQAKSVRGDLSGSGSGSEGGSRRQTLKKTNSFIQQRSHLKEPMSSRRSVTPQPQMPQRRSSRSPVSPSSSSPYHARDRTSSQSSAYSYSPRSSSNRREPQRQNNVGRNDSMTSMASSIASVDSDTMSRAEQALQKHKNRMLARASSSSNNK